MTAAKQKSRSVSKAAAGRNGAAQPADIRAVRTRQQINSAFVMLMHRRSYDSMRVSDITRKAGVGRATFYAHFTSKDDLLRSQLGAGGVADAAELSRRSRFCWIAVRFLSIFGRRRIFIKR